MIKQGFNVDPLLQKQADCISTMTYNEYWQVIEAGMKPEDLVTFKYEDQGVATLEDGLYVLEDKLKDPAFVETMAKFVKASEKGWDYARANGDEAAQIVIDNDATGAQTLDAPEAHDGRGEQAHRRLRRHARRRRRRPHRGDPDEGRFRPGHHQEAGRCVDVRRHRQGQDPACKRAGPSPARGGPFSLRSFGRREQP